MMLQAMQARQLRGDCGVMRRYIGPLAASSPSQYNIIWHCTSVNFHCRSLG